jgi:glucose-6-phosphate 1-dehydrogenase
MSLSQGKSASRRPVFVLVGGTGDLAMRMLWPSLAMLLQDGFIDEGLRLISVAREKVDTEEVRGRVMDALKKRVGKDLEHGTADRLVKNLTHLALDASDPEWGKKLKAELGDIDQLDVVYFLSVSPTLFKPICEQLRTAGLSNAPNRDII